MVDPAGDMSVKAFSASDDEVRVLSPATAGPDAATSKPKEANAGTDSDDEVLVLSPIPDAKPNGVSASSGKSKAKKTPTAGSKRNPAKGPRQTPGKMQ